ncbi:hypothetical protein LHJ74_07345 [Streptomyces sp. N2-109]|uniref:Uncharacterized protein n=1 Tax=Streptomyces gossypii TaxID=2883101 RepID=A0ABT2JQU5_9ACTN|nr:hypothetical protein [Streptomyces gossypii]MCT2589735.1 hypothetical protein [Streptomyces gossypii]
MSDVVQEFASVVVLALRGGGDPFDLLGSVLSRSDDPATVAAVRVLGADAFAPCTLRGKTPTDADVALVEGAVGAFPPKPGASSASAWSHWGMRAALHRVRTGAPGPDLGPEPDPETGWVASEPWQRMTHQLSQLAALAVPGLPSPLAAAVAKRPVDLARGFVRAVRRRDWLQAAGAGRWLAVTEGVPASLGLDGGLDLIHHMGAADARVALQVRAAQLAREGASG